MLSYNHIFTKKTTTLLAAIIFITFTVIITILFNFRGMFIAATANGGSNTNLKKIYEQQIGYVTKVYEKNGVRYLSFDDVSFLTGKEAIEAAKKDGNAIFENGQYYVMDDYYIVNKDKKIKDYVIDRNPSLNLLGFMVSPDANDINNRNIDYQKFKDTINNKNYPILCYIYTKDSTIIKVEGKYVP